MSPSMAFMDGNHEANGPGGRAEPQAAGGEPNEAVERRVSSRGDRLEVTAVEEQRRASTDRDRGEATAEGEQRRSSTGRDRAGARAVQEDRRRSLDRESADAAPGDDGACGEQSGAATPPASSEVVEQIGCRVFSEYVRSMGPTAAQLLRHTSLSRQQTMIRELMDYVAASVTSRPTDVGGLHRQAVYHAHMGIRSDEVQALSEALLGACKERPEVLPGQPDDWQRALRMVVRFFLAVCAECTKAIERMLQAVDGDELKSASRQLHKVVTRTYRALPPPAVPAPPPPAVHPCPPARRRSPEKPHRDVTDASSTLAASEASGQWTPGPPSTAPAGSEGAPTQEGAVSGAAFRGRRISVSSSGATITASKPRAPAAPCEPPQAPECADCGPAAAAVAAVCCVITGAAATPTPQESAQSQQQQRAEGASRGVIVDHSGVLFVSQYDQANPAPGPGEEHNRRLFKRRFGELIGRYLYITRDGRERPLELLDIGACELCDTGSVDSPLPGPSPYSFAVAVPLPAGAQPDTPAWSPTLPDDRKGTQGFSPLQPTPPKWPPHQGGAPQRPRPPQQRRLLRTVWMVASCDSDKDTWYERIAKVRSRFHPDLLHTAENLPRRIHLGDEGWTKRGCAYAPEDFEVLRTVGAGSFGTVCKVRDRATGEIYALKRISKAEIESRNLRDDIIRERDILIELTFPGIVRLHASFAGSVHFFLLFDYYPGGDLFMQLRMSDTLTFDNNRARFYTAEIVLALEHCRRHRIIHRDVKADNVLLDRMGHCVLTDFGFAVRGHQADRRSCGTLAYMAPEILSPHTPCTGASDWWSLGVLVFMMLTGTYPFLRQDARATAEAICRGQIVFPKEPRLSAAAVSIVGDLLRKNPAFRPSSLAEVSDHKWFRDFNWTACAERTMQAPCVPEQTHTSARAAERKPSYFVEDNLCSSFSQSTVSSDQAFFALHSSYRKGTNLSQTDDHSAPIPSMK
eukprot:TRINITY_DN65118_c0_g1_i1.p1 TRINITY_DN65118_c0_g1~~TRINITY_DN65118_c0_g1_i1.p1  ORF type:complete len:971 (+),score=169.41 TRINITY_DN65118_c0_g1_i1:69-2981(+)